MRLDLKENVEFPFSDPEWLPKIAKLSFFYLVSILFLALPLPALFGYQLEVIRQAAGGEDSKMPEFGPNFGKMWTQGFILGLVLCGIVMVPTLAIGGVCVGGAMAFQDNEGLVMGVAITGLLVFFAFLLLYTILWPAFMLRYAMTGSISQTLDFGAIINDVKQGPADFVVIALIPMAGQLVSSLASATGVGVILILPIMVLTMIVQGRMLGNYYRAYFH